MVCPECGDAGAYYGLRWVHCMNEKCFFYDARYSSKIRSENHDRAVERLAALDNFIVLPDEDDNI